jgi:nitronate monooxygenase
MFKTRVTELLGIEYPILAGPMGPKITDATLVSAVSSAGGLGILPAMEFPSTEGLRSEIRKIRDMTDKPFAVNVTLVPFYRQDIDFEEYFAAAIEEGVSIVETSARSPEPYMKMLKDAQVKVIHRATRTRDIRTAERVGVDAVTILGIEAAGLPGMEDVTSMVRIPVAKDAVGIPIIAAGGIADARGFVAALALGAEGVLLGTRFMVSKECRIHPRIKEWILELLENDTILIERSIRNTSRVVRTDFTQKILEMEQKGTPPEELLAMIRSDAGRDAYVTGDISQARISVGQVAGLIHDIPSVKEIIDRIIEEAEVIVVRLRKTVNL